MRVSYVMSKGFSNTKSSTSSTRIWLGLLVSVLPLDEDVGPVLTRLRRKRPGRPERRNEMIKLASLVQMNSEATQNFKLRKRNKQGLGGGGMVKQNPPQTPINSSDSGGGKELHTQ